MYKDVFRHNVRLYLDYLRLLKTHSAEGDKFLLKYLFETSDLATDGFASLLVLLRKAEVPIDFITKAILKFCYYSTTPIESTNRLQETVESLLALVKEGEMGYGELLDMINYGFDDIKDSIQACEGILDNLSDLANIEDPVVFASLLEVFEDEVTGVEDNE